MTTTSTIANNTNRNLSISNINIIIMIYFIAMNDISISNISTTTSTTINIDYITPPTSTMEALQSNSIKNIPMILNFVIPSKSCCIHQSQQAIIGQLSSTVTTDLIEIDFDKLLIQMSPAIARLDNFDDRNLGNNYHQLSKITMIYINSMDREGYEKPLQINYNHIQVKRFTIISFTQHN